MVIFTGDDKVSYKCDDHYPARSKSIYQEQYIDSGRWITNELQLDIPHGAR